MTQRAARLLRRRAEVARELAALDEAVAAELDGGAPASTGPEQRAPRCKPRPEDLERAARQLVRAGVYPARR